MSSRSLGTLTLDLIARSGGFVQGMDKAERSSAKWRKQVEKDLKIVARTTGAAIGAVAAATSALVVSQVKAATELRQQAQLSAATTQEFQRYAIAADTVGIGQEKLSDQLKDFNEKAGEFQRSGGGGMKDFFEQIAPQIGITADAFRDLSGPQALQLYYDSLEKAGLSQQQMSFYLESMASDTTALIPLLRNGGEGFKLLGDMAEQAGAIMSDKTVTAAEQLSAASWVAEQSMMGFRNQIAEKLLPTLADLSVQFSDVATESAIADDFASTLDGTIKGLAAAAVGAFAALQLLGRGIAGIAVAGDTLTKDSAWYERIIPPLLARRVYKNWDEAKAALGVVGDDLEETTQRYATLLNGIWSAGQEGGGSDDPENRILKLAEFMKRMREEAAKSGPGLATFSDEANKSAEAIKNQLSALDRAAITWGMSSDEVRLYDMTVQGATDSQLIHAQAVMENIEAMEREAEAKRKIIEEQKRIDGQVEGVLDFLKTEEERLADSYEERRRIIVESSIIAEEEKAALVLALNEKLNADLMAMERARQSAMLTSYGTLFESLGGLTAQFAGKQSGIARAMFAVSKAFAIADSIVKIQQGIASAAAVPFPANIPAIASVAAATAGIVSTIQGTQLQGMAHAGHENIPREGTWLLDGGERVLSPEQNRDLTKFLSKDGQGSSTANTTNAPQINFNNEITIEAESGMSPDEARANGEAAAGAAKAIFVSMVEKESRPGGLLWSLYGAGR